MSNDLGIDRSGNGNNWTVNNMTLAADQVVDSPTNNFATLNPLDTIGSPTISQGNLKSSNGNDIECRSTMHMSSGKWYWENCVTGGSYGMLGISKSGSVVINYNDTSEGGVAYYQHNGNKYIAGDGSGGISYGASYTTGDIISIAYNADDNEITFYKNNVSQGTITSIPDKVYTPSVNSATSYTGVINFGQDSSFAGNKTAQGNQDSNDIGDFYYTPPTGYLALCTKNLPDVAVTPSEHFNTVLWSGNGSTQSITGVNFQPDFTWIKNRGYAHKHQLFDAIRGATKRLYSNLTDAEATGSTSLTAFNSDGFALGADGSVNSSSYNYVGWNWKANGSGSANTVGDIDSTVSVNTDAGFSIVSYTANGSSTATVGHGLSQTAEMVFTKRRDSARNWHVGHKDLPFNSSSNSHHGYLSLNGTGASDPNNGGRANIPNATTFQGEGSNNATMIAYCFHSVDGYSKCGSYIGNGNADGTFVYTGFRPAYLLVKQSSAAGERWYIFDNKRDTYNYVDTRLVADDTNVETTGATQALDFVSNGFKARYNQGAFNTNGATYIYLAFAETPFKYSNAR